MAAALHLVVGDGVVGRAVVEELARQGLPHALASRTPPDPCPWPHRRVDALDAAALLAATAGASHVYVTLGLAYDSRVWQRDWPPIVEHFIAAARQHGFKLVFFDNVYAYGPPPLRVPMTEDHPQQPSSRKGRVRQALGERLMQAARLEGVRLVIGRSADFYGPGVRNSLLYQAAIQRQLQGKAAQWLGSPDRPHSYTYVPDAARALVRLALDEGAEGRAWHLPTAAPAPTSRQLLQMSARLLGAPAEVGVMPGWLLALLKPFVPVLREVDEMRYQTEHDYVFSSAAFEQRRPDLRATPYDEGMAAMVASLR
jgi:nucleoside-diphosphate-sugar epimerase